MHWDLGTDLKELLIPGWSDDNMRFEVSFVPVTITSVCLLQRCSEKVCVYLQKHPAPIDIIVAGKRDFSAPENVGLCVLRWWSLEVGCEGTFCLLVNRGPSG